MSHSERISRIAQAIETKTLPFELFWDVLGCLAKVDFGRRGVDRKRTVDKFNAKVIGHAVESVRAGGERQEAAQFIADRLPLRVERSGEAEETAAVRKMNATVERAEEIDRSFDDEKGKRFKHQPQIVVTLPGGWRLPSCPDKIVEMAATLLRIKDDKAFASRMTQRIRASIEFHGLVWALHFDATVKEHNAKRWEAYRRAMADWEDRPRWERDKQPPRRPVDVKATSLELSPVLCGSVEDQYGRELPAIQPTPWEFTASDQRRMLRQVEKVIGILLQAVKLQAAGDQDAFPATPSGKCHGCDFLHTCSKGQAFVKREEDRRAAAQAPSTVPMIADIVAELQPKHERMGEVRTGDNDNGLLEAAS